jgi:hypothetical protein
MTTEEITGIVRFLDLAEGSLAGGYCLREGRAADKERCPGIWLLPGQPLSPFRRV